MLQIHAVAHLMRKYRGHHFQTIGVPVDQKLTPIVATTNARNLEAENGTGLIKY